MNVIALTGHLTNDPARRDTPKGVVAMFRLAVDHTRRRLWIDIECWGQTAGIAASHLCKGRHVAVTGELVASTYHDNTGSRRERWYVKAAQLTYLDSPRLAADLGEVAPNAPGFESPALDGAQG